MTGLYLIHTYLSLDYTTKNFKFCSDYCLLLNSADGKDDKEANENTGEINILLNLNSLTIFIIVYNTKSDNKVPAYR